MNILNIQQQHQNRQSISISTIQPNNQTQYQVPTTTINGNILTNPNSTVTQPVSTTLGSNIKGNLRVSKPGFFISSLSNTIQSFNNNNDKINNNLLLPLTPPSSLNINRTKELLHIKSIQITDLTELSDNDNQNHIRSISNSNYINKVFNNNINDLTPRANYLIINLKNGKNNQRSIIKSEKASKLNNIPNNINNQNESNRKHNSSYIDSIKTFKLSQFK
jgi:hypothetical protein